MSARNRGIGLAVVVLGITLGTAIEAQAVIMNFDDLIYVANQTAYNSYTAAMGVPGNNYTSSIRLYQKPTSGNAWTYINAINNVTPYDGFQLNNFKLYPSTVTPPYNGTIEDVGTPGSGTGTNVKAQDGVSTFTFNSGYFWNYYGTYALDLTLTGMSGGSQKDGDLFTTHLSTATPTLITLNWSGIDELLIQTGSGQHLAIDCLTLNESCGPVVPEPTTVVIWSLLGGFGLAIGWRRRKRAVA